MAIPLLPGTRELDESAEQHCSVLPLCVARVSLFSMNRVGPGAPLEHWFNSPKLLSVRPSLPLAGWYDYEVRFSAYFRRLCSRP
jgi:hypothetical protein